MSRSPISFDLRIDTTLLLLPVRALSGLLEAGSAWERRIESRALEAYSEIQRMADAAREALALELPERVEIALCFASYESAIPLASVMPASQRLH